MLHIRQTKNRYLNKVNQSQCTIIYTVMNVAISNSVQPGVVDLVTMFPANCEVAIYLVNSIYRPHGDYNAVTHTVQARSAAGELTASLAECCRTCFMLLMIILCSTNCHISSWVH